MGNKYKQSASAFQKKAPDVLSNYYIRAKRVKVIDESGKFVGEMPFKVALEKAQNLDLDLIQVSSDLQDGRLEQVPLRAQEERQGASASDPREHF